MAGWVDGQVGEWLDQLEIMLTSALTNVPRTNVAWTNVVVTVVICCIYFKDPLFKV